MNLSAFQFLRAVEAALHERPEIAGKPGVYLRRLADFPRGRASLYLYESAAEAASEEAPARLVLLLERVKRSGDRAAFKIFVRAKNGATGPEHFVGVDKESGFDEAVEAALQVLADGLKAAGKDEESPLQDPPKATGRPAPSPAAEERPATASATVAEEVEAASLASS